MAEERTTGEAPSDADLAAYLDRNAARFLVPAMVSFEQIFLGEAGVAAKVEGAITAARRH